jgi:energy-coupling factor transport system ATP-binding protein
MAAFFGIEDWFHKNVAELSGGQKQLLNLASVMVLQPDLLILDEPTSQLDPIAASEFLATLGKINRELGTTILLTEHRLEDALPLATTVMVMERGRLLCSGSVQAVGQRLKELSHPMFLAMPAAMRIWAAVETDTACLPRNSTRGPGVADEICTKAGTAAPTRRKDTSLSSGPSHSYQRGLVPL